MTPHQELSKWIDDLCTRSDKFVDMAQGCAALTRGDAKNWDRKLTIESSLSDYDDGIIEAILTLLKKQSKSGKEYLEWKDQKYGI